MRNIVSNCDAKRKVHFRIDVCASTYLLLLFITRFVGKKHLRGTNIFVKTGLHCLLHKSHCAENAGVKSNVKAFGGFFFPKHDLYTNNRIRTIQKPAVMSNVDLDTFEQQKNKVLLSKEKFRFACV